MNSKKKMEAENYVAAASTKTMAIYNKQTTTVAATTTTTPSTKKQMSQCGISNLKSLTYLYDLPDSKIVDIFDEAFAFIKEGRGPGGCVLVHCNAGISRAASIVIGFLMKTEGMSFSDSFWYVKGNRPVVHPKCGFVDQLRDYEIFLRQN